MVESSTSTPYRQILLSFRFFIGNLVSGLHVLQHVVVESSADYRYVFKRIKVCHSFQSSLIGSNDLK